MQRGALEALSPIQEGASRVLKPFRDLFGWFGDTLDAKDERDKAIARARRATARSSPAARNQLREAEQQGAAQRAIDTTGGMDQLRPRRRARLRHAPRAAGTRPCTINKGTDDGVQPRRPGDQRRRASSARSRPRPAATRS